MKRDATSPGKINLSAFYFKCPAEKRGAYHPGNMRSNHIRALWLRSFAHFGGLWSCLNTVFFNTVHTAHVCKYRFDRVPVRATHFPFWVVGEQNGKERKIEKESGWEEWVEILHSGEPCCKRTPQDSVVTLGQSVLDKKFVITTLFFPQISFLCGKSNCNYRPLLNAET